MIRLASTVDGSVGDHLNRVHEARGGFRIVGRICESSPSASVYLCEEAREDDDVRLVVLKTGRRSPRSRASALPAMDLSTGAESIHQELAVATRLLEDDTPHPYIVRFHSVAKATSHDSDIAIAGSEELIVLVMEYCPRGDLLSLLEQQPDHRFAEGDALSLFRQIVSGVHHLHGLGVAHRDISLENVLLDDQGNAKICDFGLSVFMEGTHRLSSAGSVGKLQYMAPEVAAGGAYDPVLADVWSLGMVLFMLLTGSPLFQVARPSDLAWNALQKVGVRGILRHWKLEDSVSPSMVDLLTSMLRIDPLQRLQSLDVALEALT